MMTDPFAAPVSRPCHGRRFYLSLVLAVGGLAATVEAVPSAREVIDFNPGWRFVRDDVPEAVDRDFDDSAWQVVSCPHTWNDTDTFDNFGRGGHQGETELWTGAAWYRKAFTLDAADSGRRVFIEFEAVRQIADVYLNGKHLGQNRTGFIPFGFELTEHLKFGQPNFLVVRADNRFGEHNTGDTPWHHPNWHPPHGGIYRNVRLHLMDPIHVTLPCTQT